MTATTGSPLAIASMVTMDCSSASDAIANTSASRYRPGRSVPGMKPRKRTRSATPRRAASSRSLLSSGPEPASASTVSATSCVATASISTSARFSGLSLPTDRISGRPAGSAYRRRSDSSATPGE